MGSLFSRVDTILISFLKIIDSLANPDPSTKYCGTGLFAALIGHVFISVIATIVLTLKMFLGKGYDKWTKNISSHFNYYSAHYFIFTFILNLLPTFYRRTRKQDVSCVRPYWL